MWPDRPCSRGLGWLTFTSATLSRALTPYKLAPGILGETAVTLWLLIASVNPQQSEAIARRRGAYSVATP